MLLKLKQLLHPTSLKYQLFRWLFILLLPVILISALTGYALTNHYINLTYDKALYRTAMALADQVSLEELGVQVTLPQVAKDLLEFDEEDDVYFRIVGPKGDLISTHTDLPLPKTYPKDDQFLYFNALLNEKKLRVVVYALPVLAGFAPSNKNHHVYVMVGETLKKRTLMANEIMLSMLLPQLLIVLLVSALLFFGIKRGLLPLDRLKTELSERSTNDLSPVASTKLPAELHPLLATFNDLLSRVSNTIATRSIELFQNSPNPFNGNTEISYFLPKTSIASLEVLDVTGKILSVLATGIQQEGLHTSHFTSTGLTNGTYTVRLTVGSDVLTTRMMLVK